MTRADALKYSAWLAGVAVVLALGVGFYHWLRWHDANVIEQYKLAEVRRLAAVIHPTLPMNLSPLCHDGIWIAHRVDKWKDGRIAKSYWKRYCT